MSWGIVICNKCSREIHQNGPKFDDKATWTHCEDSTPACEGGGHYPARQSEIKGKWCGVDAMGHPLPK